MQTTYSLFFKVYGTRSAVNSATLEQALRRAEATGWECDIQYRTVSGRSIKVGTWSAAKGFHLSEAGKI